jgi:hypothetical protein
MVGAGRPFTPFYRGHSKRARQRFRARQQSLQAVLNRGEQDRVIDTEISVHNTIAHSGHCRPRNVSGLADFSDTATLTQ